MEKIAILDYASGQLKIIQIEKDLSSEEVESIVEENYGYRTRDIHWMKIIEISVDHITV